MAIDWSDSTAISYMLHKVHGDFIAEQFPREQITYNDLPKASAGMAPGGLGYEFPIGYEDPMGGGARLEDERLPPGLASKGDKFLVLPKAVYQTIRLSGLAIAKSQNDRMSYVRGLTREVKGAYQSVVTQLNRQSQGDGFGLLATLSEASDAVTTSGSTTWTITCDNDRGVDLLKDGMLVDSFVSTAVDQSSVASRVSYVDYVNKTAEMEPNDGTYKAVHPIAAMAAYTITTDVLASGQLIVAMAAREASHATSNTAREIMGLKGIFDDGTLLATFQDITVATQPKVQAKMMTNSSVARALSLELLYRAVMIGQKHGTGKKMTVVRMPPGQKMNYALLLGPDVRFQPEKLRGGYSEVTFSMGEGRVNIITDWVQEPDYIYVHPEGIIQKFELKPLGFGDIDPGLKNVANYDSYTQFLRIYTNIGATERASCICLKDLSVSDLY